MLKCEINLQKKNYMEYQSSVVFIQSSFTHLRHVRISNLSSGSVWSFACSLHGFHSSFSSFLHMLLDGTVNFPTCEYTVCLKSCGHDAYPGCIPASCPVYPALPGVTLTRSKHLQMSKQANVLMLTK